jgi:glycerate kinase
MKIIAAPDSFKGNMDAREVCAAIEEGGPGAALRICLGAQMESGAVLVMKYARFFDRLPGTDLAITGEGMTDGQTAGGKLCSVAARDSRRDLSLAAENLIRAVRMGIQMGTRMGGGQVETRPGSGAPASSGGPR